MEWELPSLDLVHMTDWFSYILDESPKRKTVKILSFQLGQSQPTFTLSFYCCCKKPRHWKKIVVMNLSAQGTFHLLVGPSTGLTILSDGAIGALPNLPLQSTWRNHSPDWELVSNPIDMEAALSSFKPIAIQSALPQSIKTVQIVGVSNTSQPIPVSEPVSFCVGSLRDTAPFLLSYSTSFMCWAEIS